MSLGMTDESNSVFMFEITKRNASSLKETWSQTCNINNLTWQLRVSKYIDKKHWNDEYLSVYLHCEPPNNSELWCCTARVRLVLRSLREGVQDYPREFVQLFSSSAMVCGYPDFLKWTEVIDPNKGYVVDDVIKVQAQIDANAPQNVDPYQDDEECPHYVETWKTLLEDDINIKIVRRISEELKELNETMHLGHKNVARVLTEKLDKILDSALAPVLEKIGSLQERLGVISTNQNPFGATFSEEHIEESILTALFSVEQRIHARLQKIEKISVDNVATLVNQFKSLSLKDKENNVENGIVADKDKNNVKKASTSDGEPILVSILKILHEVRNDVKRESLFLYRRRFAGCCSYNSDDVRSCHGSSGFFDNHTHLRPDAERDHLFYNRFAPWRECSSGSPCMHSTFPSTVNNQQSRRKPSPFSSSCISLPHLFQKTENDLENRKPEETESNFSGVFCSSNNCES